jgi:hypothetical protein
MEAESDCEMVSVGRAVLQVKGFWAGSVAVGGTALDGSPPTASTLYDALAQIA